jgi:Ca2+-binding RTX toxin-like protein
MNIVGSNGNDLLVGSQSIDTIFGLGGSDRLYGGGANDLINGGDGNDVLNGNQGDDVIDGGDGSDWAIYLTELSEDERPLGYRDDDDGRGIYVDLRIAGPQFTGSSSGTDTLISIENLVGTKGDDVLIGNESDNILVGDNGDDRLIGGGGNDTFFGDLGPLRDPNADPRENYGNNVYIGGDGIDTLDYSFHGDADNGLHVNLAFGQAQFVGGGSTDIIRQIENLIGSAGSDVLIGNSQANTIFGGSGFFGGSDNNRDTISGGGGADTLIAGYGDTFVYERVGVSKVGAADTIVGFSHSAGDLIDLSAIDAISGKVHLGDQAFVFGGSTFTRTAGELIQVAFAGGYQVIGDINGDGRADFEIRVETSSALLAADFVL